MKLGSWLAILGCVGVTVTASIASQGCTATVAAGNGSGDDTGDDTGGDSGTPITQEDSGSVPNACNECLYGQCAGLYSICVGDTGCLAIYECATAASCVADTTGACVTACINAQSASSQALYDNLGICDFEAECNGGSCGGTCNPTADYCSPTVTDDGGTDANPSSDDAGADSASTVDSGASDDAGQSTVDSAAPLTCDQCQKSACATQLTACSTSGSACFTYNQCVLGCASAQCVSICGTNNPSGLAAAQALGTCTTTNCPVCSSAQ
jgi:hypothetical protein